jgi:hypothetical protein
MRVRIDAPVGGGAAATAGVAAGAWAPIPATTALPAPASSARRSRPPAASPCGPTGALGSGCFWGMDSSSGCFGDVPRLSKRAARWKAPVARAQPAPDPWILRAFRAMVADTSAAKKRRAN